MRVDENRTDRSYLYGRLTSIMLAADDNAVWQEEFLHNIEIKPNKVFYSVYLNKFQPYATKLKETKPKYADWLLNRADEILDKFASVDEYMSDEPLDKQSYFCGWQSQDIETHRQRKQ